MNIFHILNGDALFYSLPENYKNDTSIVVRECLVEGPLSGEGKDEFWKNRYQFLQKEYRAEFEDFQNRTVLELNKITAIPAGSEVNLWFEDDLFCQVHLWFCADLLKNGSDFSINWVRPYVHSIQPDWRGFGPLTSQELEICLENKQKLSYETVIFLSQLWNAFKANDLNALSQLSNQNSDEFPFLREVVTAHIDRFPPDGSLGRPQRLLSKILKSEEGAHFSNIFRAFSLEAGIYGFGDSQVQRLLKDLPSDH